MQIKVGNAQPGMVLCADTPFPGGKIVLKKGQKLTSEILAAMIKVGISVIEVDDVPAVSGTLPKITVTISNDASYAYMSIEPAGNANEIITFDILYDQLNKNGVVSGIDEKALKNVVAMWQEKKHRYDISKVAISKAATPAKEGVLRMLVRGITTADEFDKVRGGKMFWQIKDVALQYQSVTPGMILAEKDIAIESIPGSNVRGEPIFTDEVVSKDVVLEKGVIFSADKTQVQATANGFVYYIGEHIGVVDVNFDGMIEIIPSTDRMKAMMEIHAPGDGGKMPDEQAIRQMLKNQKIVFGLHEELLKNILFGFVNGEYPSEPVAIAEGVPAQNGTNGRVELLFNTETSLKPKENSDGSVDYKNVNIINSIAKGDKLAVLLPPTKGIPGRNILGDTVPGIDGVASKLPIGANTEIDHADPNSLIASLSGVVKYTGSSVEISEGFVVKGDVDFSTGNIKYEKSVMIAGDIKGGFNVECGGDLQIGGVIEDCHVVVGGNVLCKFGFVGQGKGLVEAKGDVNLGFMKGQILKCRGNVNIAREVLNSTVYARKNINVHGNPLSIAGGTLVARDSITFHTVGNHSGIKTLLEVGIDFTLVEELEKTEAALAELTVNYSKLVESQTKYTKIIAIKGNSASQERAMVAKLVESITKYKLQMNALEERKKLIQRKMYYLDIAYIKIVHAALPGTLFKFGERHFLVKDEVIGPKTVRLIEHEIRIL